MDLKTKKKFNKWSNKSLYLFNSNNFWTSLINFDYEDQKFDKSFFEFYLFSLEKLGISKDNFNSLLDEKILKLSVDDKFKFMIEAFEYYHPNCKYFNNLKLFLQSVFDYRKVKKLDYDKEYQILKKYWLLKNDLLNSNIRDFNNLIILINSNIYDHRKGFLKDIN